MKITRRIISILLAAVLLVTSAAYLSGCARSDWEGTWNRTGDATYSRAVMNITDVNSKGFTFSMTLFRYSFKTRS